MVYACKTKCFWNGRLFEVGDTVEESAVTPPEHFILIDGEAEKPAEEKIQEQKVKPAATRARKGRASEAARFKNG